MKTVIDVDPYANDPLAQRLHDLQIATPAVLGRVAEDPPPPYRQLARHQRAVRRAWRLGTACAAVAIAALLGIGVFHVGTNSPVTVRSHGYKIELAAARGHAPHMSSEEATAIALRWLSEHPFRPQHGAAGQFTGFTPISTTYEPQVLKIWHHCGAHWFFYSPETLWVVDLRAPAQLGVAYVQASVLINDDNGRAEYTDALFGPTAPPQC